MRLQTETSRRETRALKPLQPGSGRWHVVHCRPRQELVALENLQRQSFQCYLPLLEAERVGRSGVVRFAEPLFPRYLFIRLEADGQNWLPIRSTRGVSCLVQIGGAYAKLPDEFVDSLKAATLAPRPLFAAGEPVRVVDGPFRGLEGIFGERDGDARAIVLLEILGRQQKLPLPLVAIRRAC